MRLCCNSDTCITMPRSSRSVIMTLTVSQVTQPGPETTTGEGGGKKGRGVQRKGGAGRGDNWSCRGPCANRGRCGDPTLAIDTTDGRQKEKCIYIYTLRGKYVPQPLLASKTCQVLSFALFMLKGALTPISAYLLEKRETETETDRQRQRTRTGT